MRLIIPLLAATWVALASPAPAAIPRNDLPAPAPLTFSDGAVATPYDHCGDADLCATIAYPNGDTLLLYSEGSAFCQPYEVEFVRVHQDKPLFEFTRALNHDLPGSQLMGHPCGNNRPTQMTMDHGLVHLTIDEYPDGTLRLEFTSVPPK